ncbi:MAG TPA: hypothetical protein VJ986_06770, partial [Gaiellaceae bacterium]|nr:hypothetical protein [Gaiellaceae bacterium]
GRAYLYPHGATSMLMAFWDGLYPASSILSGALVTAPGHVEVARRWGYPHPVYVVGWSLCELRPRRVTGRTERILFAPSHPPGILDGYEAPPEHAEVFQRLLELHAQLTVRYLGPLEANGIPVVDGVEYVRGDAPGAPNMLAQIDASDVVVGDRGTFASLAVARGVTAVMWQSALLMSDDTERRPADNLELYADYARFPFDLADGDAADVIAAAAEDEERVADWRARFIGDPLDSTVLAAALSGSAADYQPENRAPRSSRLHAGALAALEQERPAGADALLIRALAETVDLELVNDLAVLRVRDAPAEAEALLRTALAIDPTREDARENLAALERQADAASGERAA